jgi:hypothetical protein
MPPWWGISHHCPPESTGSDAPGLSWAQCASGTGQCGLPGPMANRRHRCLNTHRDENKMFRPWQLKSSKYTRTQELT